MAHLELHLRQLEHEVASPILDFRKRYVALALTYSPDRRVVETDEALEHTVRLVKRTVAVVLAHAVLLQKVVFEHARNLERDLVVLAERALSNKLHDLGQIFLLLQDFLRLHAKLDETGGVGLVVRLEDLGVLGI